MLKCMGKNCQLRNNCKRFLAILLVADTPIENCDSEFRPGFLPDHVTV